MPDAPNPAPGHEHLFRPIDVARALSSYAGSRGGSWP